MAQLITRQLIFSYLEDKCNPVEIEIIQQWLADPANKPEADSILSEYWSDYKNNEEYPSTDYAALYNKILVRTGGQPVSGARFRRMPLRIAAAAAVAVVVTALSWLLLSKNTLSFQTAYGETKKITLPDGSIVTLNSNSVIRYAADWKNAADREVYLEGEAYFSVKHMPGNEKFRVATKAKFKVEVLGTEFSVYKRDENAHVILNSGKVKVNFDEETRKDVIMAPGELVEVMNKNNLTVSRKKVNAIALNAWKDGKLVFDETSMTELTQLLLDNYGLKLVVKDLTLMDKKINGTLPASNRQLLLEALETVLQVDLQLMKDDTLLMRNQN